tara:strand:+ start:3438 stop:4559 length:1122 start_codon:yes stop_codon:yes gene_type:complete
MANWKQILTEADLSTSLKTIAVVSDPGGTWGTNNITLNSFDSTLKFVNGTGITIQTDTANDAIKITASADANTTYTLGTETVDSASSKIRLTGSDSSTEDIIIAAGTGLSIAESGDTITLTNTVSNTDTDTTYSLDTVTVNAAAAKIRLSDSNSPAGTDDITLAAGTGLSVAETGDTITFTNTVSNTDVNVSNANLRTALANLESPNGSGTDETMTIGADAGDTLSITGSMTIGGDLTVNGSSTTLKVSTLEVNDKIITLAHSDSPTGTTGDDAGIEVMSNSTKYATIKYSGANGQASDVGSSVRTGWMAQGEGSSDNFGEIMVAKYSASAPTSSNDGMGVGSLWIKTDADGETSSSTKIFIRVGDTPGTPTP